MIVLVDGEAEDKLTSQRRLNFYKLILLANLPYAPLSTSTINVFKNRTQASYVKPTYLVWCCSSSPFRKVGWCVTLRPYVISEITMSNIITFYGIKMVYDNENVKLTF